MTSTDTVMRPWNGGACPVRANARVRVVRRYAGESVGTARNFRWSHDLYCEYGADDIVGYAVLD